MNISVIIKLLLFEQGSEPAAEFRVCGALMFLVGGLKKCPHSEPTALIEVRAPIQPRVLLKSCHLAHEKNPCRKEG